MTGFLDFACLLNGPVKVWLRISGRYGGMDESEGN